MGCYGMDTDDWSSVIPGCCNAIDVRLIPHTVRERALARLARSEGTYAKISIKSIALMAQ